MKIMTIITVFLGCHSRIPSNGAKGIEFSEASFFSGILALRPQRAAVLDQSGKGLVGDGDVNTNYYSNY